MRNSGKIIDCLDMALRFKTDGNYASMLDYLDRALKLKPDANILMIKAKALMFLQEYSLALTAINKAIEMETNHLFFIIKAQIQGALFQFEDSLVSIETAIAIYDCAFYQAFKAQALFISGKVLEGIDHLLWIKLHYNELKNTDDIRFLFSLLSLAKPFQIEFESIEKQLVEKIDTTPEPNKTGIVRFFIDTDLIANLADHMGVTLITRIVINGGLSAEEQIMFLIALKKWEFAKGIIEQNRGYLDVVFLQYCTAVIDLKKDNICSAETILNMPEWHADAKFSFIDILWDKKHYISLKKLFHSDQPSTTVTQWMQFWISILDGEIEASSELLEAIPQGLDTIFKAREKSSSYLREAFGDNFDPANLNFNLDTILKYFPFDLPYDLLSWELFIRVVKKIFPVQFLNIIDQQVQLIDRKSIEPMIINNTKYHEYYQNAHKKVELINSLSMLFITGGSSHFAASLAIVVGSSRVLRDKMYEIVDSSREEERNKILSDLSHNIKNLLRSVIDPLESIKKELPEKNTVIDDALKGANLIREMVNSINFSYTFSIDDLVYDVTHPGNESSSLQSIIIQTLKAAISHMFDSQYYPQFMSNYFKNRSAYSDADREWNLINQNLDASRLIGFVGKYMFDLSLKVDPGQSLIIGNEKSSAIKMTILLQEVILNAVKYVSYVSLVSRKLDISLVEEEEHIAITVSNTYRPEVKAKTTGLGNVIIKNFSNVLGCDITTKKFSDNYTVILILKNYWSQNG